MRTNVAHLTIAVAVLLAAGCGGSRTEAYAPRIDPAEFGVPITNPYWPLAPGTTLVYSEEERGDHRTNTVTVTDRTRVVMGVPCVVVHDVVMRGETMVEDTDDWYAQDRDGAVWYFGEETREYDGGHVSTKGSWEGGKGGAQPGIIMPAAATPGPVYRQEYLAGEAEDVGQIVATDQTVTVPAGTFTGCIKTKEYSLLEAGIEHKWYAKGIGFVQSEKTGGETVKLVSITRPERR